MSQKTTNPTLLSCDVGAVRAALARLRAKLETLPHVTLDKVEAKVAALSGTLGDYYGGLEPPDMAGAGQTDFALSVAIASTLEGVAPTTTHEVVQSGPTVVHYGDLHVTGDLDLDSFLIVLGDLRVDGVLRDVSEWCHLWVTGSVRAKAVKCLFTGWIGGKLEADAVVLGRWSSLAAIEGIHTPIAIRNTYDGDGFQSAVSAKRSIDVEKDGNEALRELPEKFVQVEEEDSDDAFLHLDEEAFVRAVAQGEAIALRT